MNLEDLVEALPEEAFSALAHAVDRRRRRQGDDETRETLGVALGDPVSLEEVELAHIHAVLCSVDGHRVRAAEILQIGEHTVYRKLPKLAERGLVVP